MEENHLLNNNQILEMIKKNTLISFFISYINNSFIKKDRFSFYFLVIPCFPLKINSFLGSFITFC